MLQVRVGLIGTGLMGKAHSIAYASMPMFFWPAPAIPVRALVASATERGAREAESRFGFDASTTDWRRIIDDPTIDVVDISTPNYLHSEMAIAAAEAGKHVFCEKPLGCSGSEAKLMLDAAELAGVVHMVAFNYRKVPAVALARKFIDEGAIGKIMNFRGTFLQGWSASTSSPASWRFQKSHAGAGAVADLGTHVIDLAHYLVGPITAVSGSARTIVTTRTRPQVVVTDTAERRTDDRIPIDVDDEMLMMVRFAGDAVGSIEVTRNAHGRHNSLSFEIHGTEGSLSFDYNRRDQLKLFLAQDPADRRGFRAVHTGPDHPYGEGLWPIPSMGLGYSEIMVLEVHDLMKSIADGAPATPSFLDGWRASVVSDASLASSASGGLWVDVNPDAGHGPRAPRRSGGSRSQGAHFE